MLEQQTMAGIYLIYIDHLLGEMGYCGEEFFREAGFSYPIDNNMKNRCLPNWLDVW